MSQGMLLPTAFISWSRDGIDLFLGDTYISLGWGVFGVIAVLLFFGWLATSKVESDRDVDNPSHEQ